MAYDPQFERGRMLRVSAHSEREFDVELIREDGSLAWKWPGVLHIEIDSHVIIMEWEKKIPSYPATTSQFVIRPKIMEKLLEIRTIFDSTTNTLVVKVRPRRLRDPGD